MGEEREMEVNGKRVGQNRGERKHISGGKGHVGQDREEEDNHFRHCSSFPTGDSPVMQEKRGITRRLEEGGQEEERGREGGKHMRRPAHSKLKIFRKGWVEGGAEEEMKRGEGEEGEGDLDDLMRKRWEEGETQAQEMERRECG